MRSQRTNDYGTLSIEQSEPCRALLYVTQTLSVDQIDEVVMVGGSARIPLCW